MVESRCQASFFALNNNDRTVWIKFRITAFRISAIPLHGGQIPDEMGLERVVKDLKPNEHRKIIVDIATMAQLTCTKISVDIVSVTDTPP